MLHQLPTLQRLIRHLQKVPYLASKNVYKVAAHFLMQDPALVALFCKTLLEAREAIKLCTSCFNWAEGNDECLICLSPSRDKELVCVVEAWHDITALENAGGFRGVYHVLGGALCPLEGIGPEKLRINELLKRLDAGVREVILATNQTPEGDATASYIASKITARAPSLIVSRLASGIPMGSTLEFMDRVTIAKALSGRRPF